MTVLVLTEVKDFLNISGNADDATLPGFIAAAEKAVGKIVGPLEPTTVTARVTARFGGLVLPVTPVVSLTSVTPLFGEAISLDGLDIDPVSGLVASVTGFAARTYTVVYVAGWEEVPADVRLAAKRLIRHLWEDLRGSTGTPNGGPPSVPGEAHALPYRVTELLDPYDPTTGFA